MWSSLSITKCQHLAPTSVTPLCSRQTGYKFHKNVLVAVSSAASIVQQTTHKTGDGRNAQDVLKVLRKGKPVNALDLPPNTCGGP